MEQEHNLLVVSDLHLSEGLDLTTGKTSRLEDFFFDDAFARFLHYHEEVKDQPRFGGRPWLLILNGDLFDFLQVVSMPDEGLPLHTVRGKERCEELSANERNYGLGTTARESEWKLKQIARGHQCFFAALGWFVAHGNHVVVVKGNHDAELCWEAVQERFVVEAKRAYIRRRSRLGSGPPLSLEACEERIRFYPWFYYEPERVYVEHGCQYEAANHFRDFLNPVLPDDPERLELPWGSLFVRYLFNKVEDVHPFADNVKPLTRYLRWAFRTDPIKTVEVLMTRGWVFLRAFWKVGRKSAALALQASGTREQGGEAVPIPLPESVTKRIDTLAQQRIEASWQDWLGSALRGVLSLLTFLIIATFVALAGVSLVGVGGPRWLALPYLVAAAIAYFMHGELKRALNLFLTRSYLLRAAEKIERILAPDHAVRYVVMGHDHKAAIEPLERAWYVNTGAWVPVYEERGIVRGREELSFFRLTWGHEGPPELLRWDDAAGAPARVVLWRNVE